MGNGRFTKGHTVPQEVRDKISAARKGMKFTDEHRQNISLHSRGYQSGETRRKISDTMKGQKKSLEMRKKLSEAKKGPGALHFWKGGLTAQNLTIRGSFEYRLWRQRVYERDDYTCQFCHVRGGKLNADHIKPFSDYPELRFDLENGRTLCEDCHRTTPTFGARNAKKDRKMALIVARELLKSLNAT